MHGTIFTDLELDHGVTLERIMQSRREFWHHTCRRFHVGAARGDTQLIRSASR
jgi:hypothetical protein